MRVQGEGCDGAGGLVERCTDRLREEDEGHVHPIAGIVP